MLGILELARTHENEHYATKERATFDKVHRIGEPPKDTA
jgi:hypothetical protein